MAALNKVRALGAVDDTVVLCATHRLARNLRLAHDQAQAAAGHTRWQPVTALTPAQWLDAIATEALLTGALPAATAPRLALTAAQERLLWERIIESETGAAPEALFFDHAGLAAAAAEAHALVEGWRLRLGEPGDLGDYGEETLRFLRWRSEFRRRCDAAGWRDASRLLEWQLAALAGGAGRLPARILFAGYDRYTPQEQRLAAVLEARGCAVAELELGAAEDAAASVAALPDREAECHAAVAWVAGLLAEQPAAQPAARLGIVVPELAALRATLAAALDDALHPAALLPANAAMPRRYNFSLGLPLARAPLVDTALRLLRLAVGMRRVEQVDFSELLRGRFWSADDSEADVRACLEARLRELLAPCFSFERLLRCLRREHGRGLAAPRLLGHLEALAARAALLPRRQQPSQWAGALRELLAAAGWPGERALSSHEFQAREAFREIADSLAQFDALGERITLAEAVSRLAQTCRERVFQPETEGDPQVQVMGPLEAAGAQFDALWVMGMNDDVWPPAARPNPLLPAELQRRAGTPGASAEVEAGFALAIQRRLLRSAPVVVFSWAAGEGDRVRRPSPLLAALPVGPVPAALPTLAERLCATQPMEQCDDSRAPPLAPGEHVGGGTRLLQAQAICPAWAYYRYRLGARGLDEPAEGLDARARGSLLHAVLEAFWRGRSQQELQAMTAAVRTATLDAAIAAALAAFDAAGDEPLPPRIAALERERLHALVDAWLDIEAARPAPFRVVACEERHELTIAGLAVKLTVDRIDELDDGRRIVLDYKTGGGLEWASWAAPRLVEPQLPVYAAYVAAPIGDEAAGAVPVDAVAFARVRAGDEGFVGIAAASGLLPEVAGLAEKAVRKRFAEAAFPDWPSVLRHWHTAIDAVAREVCAGDAAVRFDAVAALEYCEVKPLLRLAEYRSQKESAS